MLCWRVSWRVRIGCVTLARKCCWTVRNIHKVLARALVFQSFSLSLFASSGTLVGACLILGERFCVSKWDAEKICTFIITLSRVFIFNSAFTRTHTPSMLPLKSAGGRTSSAMDANRERRRRRLDQMGRQKRHRICSVDGKIEFFHKKWFMECDFSH